ncbi:MAG: PP2C family protein-serine/threonine phosphatase [Acidobacteriota bacterium]
MKESIIQQVPLFASLPPGEIHYLAETLNTVNFKAGSLVFHEDEYGDRFYIVHLGQIEIIKSMGTEDELLIAVRGPGHYVGEMSLFIPDGLRTASVRALTDIELIEMTRADFDALLHRFPTLAYELVRESSERLNDSHEVTISGLREKNRQLTIAYEELKAAQAQLIEKERLEKELAVARQIQESILPRTLPQMLGLDVGAYLHPTRAVGGDLFDLIDLGGDKLGVAVADVSDKGVPAAIFMALTRSLLRVEARRLVSPLEVAQNVNRAMLEMNDAGMFVTLLYGIVDGATREFHYVRAGHEMPLIVDSQGDLMTLEHAPGQPLGLFDDPALDEQRVVLNRQSMVLAYTDGVTDQRNQTDEFFGLERLQQAVRGQRGNSAQMICDKLYEAVDGFRGSEDQSDDITFVAIQVE